MQHQAIEAIVEEDGLYGYTSVNFRDQLLLFLLLLLIHFDLSLPSEWHFTDSQFSFISSSTIPPHFHTIIPLFRYQSYHGC